MEITAAVGVAAAAVEYHVRNLLQKVGAGPRWESSARWLVV